MRTWKAHGQLGVVVVGALALACFAGQSCDSGGTGGSTSASGTGSTGSTTATTGSGIAPGSAAKPIFLILMENHTWAQVKGSASAPYINGTLLPKYAHAEQYYNPPGLHPSEPNYIYLEAGDNLGITADLGVSINHQSTTDHLVTQIEAAKLSWRSYQEDISGMDCPIDAVNKYVPRHNPMVFFDDVTNTMDPMATRCIEHVRPYTELAKDLTNDTVADYNFLTPNLCDDGHDSCPPQNDQVKQIDDWLSINVPPILASKAYDRGGVVMITWDEAEPETSDGPIGFIALSKSAKVGYAGMVKYTHASTVKTVQELLKLTPLLRHAGDATTTDLSDLFTTFP
jgi:hypothetical protein